MEEPRARSVGLRRPLAAAFGGAALLVGSCYLMIALVDHVADGEDVSDADFDRLIGFGTAIGGVMEAGFFVSCWAAFVATSRLLRTSSTRVRRIAAALVTVGWFACLVALQFAVLMPHFD